MHEGQPQSRRLRHTPSPPAAPAGKLTHVDARGRITMVDVGDKPVTNREAVARGWIAMSAEARRLVKTGAAKKGDPLQAARVAGIMAAKQTPSLIPLCHPLPLSTVQVELTPTSGGYEIEARVRTTAQTGVEMEALTAVAVAALTMYDMVKAVDRRMTIGGIRLVFKSGGRSGTFERLPRKRLRPRASAAASSPSRARTRETRVSGGGAPRTVKKRHAPGKAAERGFKGAPRV